MLYEDEIMGIVPEAGAQAQSQQEWYAEEPPEDEPAEKKSGLSQSVVLFFRDIVIAFVVLILILQFVRPTLIFEHSMEDTLHPQDYVFLAKQAYTFGEIERGDVVVFKSVLLDKHGNGKNLIKRVVGLPGDTIEIKDGSVYLNGDRLEEPYTKDGVTETVRPIMTVPEGEYYVMGDNRAVSLDSRSSEVGCVARENFVGKVFFRLFPISTAGKVE